MTLRIEALILMGGQNKRMNGNHKAFLSFNDMSFLEVILKSLDGFSKVYLSVDDKNKFSHLPYPLIEDLYPQIGPMGGIASALTQIDSPYLFVTACDMPFITKDYVDYMIHTLTTLSHEVDCLVLCDEDGFFYPLGAIYSKKMLPRLLDMINNGQYRLQQLIRQSQYYALPIKDTPIKKEVLNNINTPEDYEKFVHK